MSINYAPLLDLGNAYVWIAYGIIAGIISFIIAVFVEAKIAKNFFKLRRVVRLRYSFIANLVSVLPGVIPLILGFRLPNSTLRWILIAFVITIIAEFIVWIMLLRAKNREVIKVLWFCFLGNLASYATIFLIAFLYEVIVFLIVF